MKKIYREYLKFIFFLIVVSILTSYLMDMISKSWDTPLMDNISNAIKTVDPSGTSIFIMFVIGFYIGSSILLALDKRKRVQAIILLFGIIVLYAYMSSHFRIGWNVIYIVIGAVIGGYLGVNREDIADSKKAASNISLFSVIYAAISLIILYSSTPDNSNFIRDAVVLLIYAFFFGKLMSYEVQGEQIFILGPEESGKTLFLAGCYKWVVDTVETSTRRSDDLIKLMKEIAKEGWAGRTGDIKTYEFTHETGVIFPRKSIIRAIDYPGVYLKDIATYIGIETTTETDKIKAAQEVSQADKLIFIIDSSRIPRFEEMGIDYYLSIITKIRDSGKNIRPYIVVTKCDLFKESYPNYENDYEGFREFIQSKISENLFIRELMIESSNKTIYPVFYYTRKIEEIQEIQENAQQTNGGEFSLSFDKQNDKQKPQKKYAYVPIQDSFGNIHTYGFDIFMNELLEN